MDFRAFERRAFELFDEVPEEFLEGIDGLEVTRRTVPHPELPDVYTLGECLTEQYPSEYGGAGEVRSVVALYYGSFLALSRLEEDFDWEGELYETLTHELRHHLESLATEDELEEIDYAEDQNFRRREGEPFDPFFFRLGLRRGRNEWEVDGERFVEEMLEPGSTGVVKLASGESVRLPEGGDVYFTELPDERVSVLVRRRGWWRQLRDILAREPLRVLEGEIQDEP